MTDISKMKSQNNQLNGANNKVTNERTSTVKHTTFFPITTKLVLRRLATKEPETTASNSDSSLSSIKSPSDSSTDEGIINDQFFIMDKKSHSESGQSNTQQQPTMSFLENKRQVYGVEALQTEHLTYSISNNTVNNNSYNTSSDMRRSNMKRKSNLQGNESDSETEDEKSENSLRTLTFRNRRYSLKNNTLMKRKNLCVKKVPTHQTTDLLTCLSLVDDDKSNLRKRLEEFDITMTGSDIIYRANEHCLRDPNTYLWNLSFLPGNRSPDPPLPPPLLPAESYDKCCISTRLYPQTPSVYLNSSDDAHSPELRQFCLSQPVAIVRNLASVLRLDLGLFSTKMLVNANPSHKIEQRIQDLQPPDENKDPTGKTILRCHSSKSITTIQEYANYQARTFIEARQAECVSNVCLMPSNPHYASGNKMTENGYIDDRKIINTSASEDKKRKKKIYFGTNCDLSKESKWQIQLQELNKLPNFLQVSCSGNLLSHCGFTIMGMNSVQLYMKVPGCRTPGHQENNNFCSVNINIGPGDCEWFSVPDQYWGAINSLCEEHKIDYLSGSWWPSLDDLKERQIPVYRFIQRPGELAWINAGTVHWVQAIGWCNNVAWNVGPFDSRQYSLAMERYEFNKIKMYKSIVPMVHLSWQLAENVKIVDSHLFQLIKYTLMVSIINCTLTWNILEKANVPLVYQPREENEPTQYCEDCESEIFNIFLIKPIKSGLTTKKSSKQATYETRCLNCALKINRNLSSFKSLYQYKLLKLEEIYDSFQL